MAILALLVRAPSCFSAGLAAPARAVVVLVLVLPALVVLGVLWFRRRPCWVLPLPVLAAADWFGAISAGEARLGWTARARARPTGRLSG